MLRICVFCRRRGSATPAALGLMDVQVLRAKGCGIAEALTVADKAGVDGLADRVGAGPLVAVVRIDGEGKPRCLPSRDGIQNKALLRRAPGFDSM